MQLFCSLLIPTCTGYAKIHYGTFFRTNPIMKFISLDEIYFTLISSTIDSAEVTIRSEMIVWQSILPWNHLRALETLLRDLYALNYPFLVIYFMRGSKTRLVRDENRTSPKIVIAKSIVPDVYFLKHPTFLSNPFWAPRSTKSKIFCHKSDIAL